MEIDIYMYLNKIDIYVLSWLCIATSSFPVLLGHRGCTWHLTWAAGDQGTEGDRLCCSREVWWLEKHTER